MKLELFRTILDPDTTHGMLSIDGEWFCNTIEDTDRHLETHPENKIHGRTAIPRSVCKPSGTYEVRVSLSNRFKKRMLEVVDVPGFTGVRIHGGRDHRDTEGCVLVGRLDGDKLVAGIATSNRLLALVEAAITRGETVTLEVR